MEGRRVNLPGGGAGSGDINGHDDSYDALANNNESDILSVEQAASRFLLASILVSS